MTEPKDYSNDRYGQEPEFVVPRSVWIQVVGGAIALWLAVFACVYVAIVNRDLTPLGFAVIAFVSALWFTIGGWRFRKKSLSDWNSASREHAGPPIPPSPPPTAPMAPRGD